MKKKNVDDRWEDAHLHIWFRRSILLSLDECMNKEQIKSGFIIDQTLEYTLNIGEEELHLEANLKKGDIDVRKGVIQEPIKTEDNTSSSVTNIITTSSIFHFYHHNHHHLPLSSSQTPPSVTIIITTTIICHYHHHNHHQLPLLSSPQQSLFVTFITTTITICHFHHHFPHLTH